MVFVIFPVSNSYHLTHSYPGIRKRPTTEILYVTYSIFHTEDVLFALRKEKVSILTL